MASGLIVFPVEINMTAPTASAFHQVLVLVRPAYGMFVYVITQINSVWEALRFSPQYPFDSQRPVHQHVTT